MENLGIMIDGVSEIVQHHIKQHESGIFSMPLGTLGVSVLGSMLNEDEATSFKQYRDSLVFQRQIYNHGHDILRLSDVLPNFTELPHELPKDLRLSKLGNIRKISKLH